MQRRGRDKRTTSVPTPSDKAALSIRHYLRSIVVDNIALFNALLIRLIVGDDTLCAVKADLRHRRFSGAAFSNLFFFIMALEANSGQKPSLTFNLNTNGLKVTSEPPPMAGQAGCLLGQDRSAVTHRLQAAATLATTAVPTRLHHWLR
ncbi:hypothetical protein J6590_053998 [Homalodisca vitripennis]|nr:hypothetical protein J6590_053998 [Homalodisca vitripennis]